MQYLERLLKNRPITFLAVTFIVAGFIASAFQELGNAITNLIAQIPILNNWFSIFCAWLGILLFIILFSIQLDKKLMLKQKETKIRWDIINNKYARIHLVNEENFSLEDCTGELFRMTVFFNEKSDDASRQLKYKHFAWSNEAHRGQSQRVTTIPARRDAILDIAKVESGKLIFTFAYHTEQKEEVGKYFFAIQIYGYKNGYEFETSPQEFVLDFNGETVVVQKDREEKQ